MNRQPYQKPPQWWPPKLSRRWIACWRQLRKREERRKQRLLGIQFVGLEHVRQVLRERCGVLITPNHPTHADCYPLYEAADALGTAFYVMTAWQLFEQGGWFQRMVLSHHGCFSVDREGADLNAIRQAREVLESAAYPLVMFPEGEVYHLNDRITPFREGAARISLMAAKKGPRPVVSVPCALRFRYVQDPTPELLDVMTQLELALFWRPRHDLTLAQRIHHFAEGLLALKETEFLGGSCAGPFTQRLDGLIEFILGRIEAKYAFAPDDATIPERVKAARRYAIERMTDLPDGGAEQKEYEHDLDDLFLVVQAFSYPGDYLTEDPSLERMAETIDKFEEDVLGVPTATIRGSREAIVRFGEPISVEGDPESLPTVEHLTRRMERGVQSLLDEGKSDEFQRS